MLIKDIRFWLIIGATAVIMLAGLGARDLWNPDEPRYAQVAREMVEGGDWLLMHLNGRLYPDKPPGYFWATGLFSRVTGRVDEFSARFFPAVSGIAVVALSMLLAGRIFGRRNALLTGVILATSYTVIMQSRWVHMDMPLTAVMMLMFFVMYRGAFERRRGRLWLWFFALGAIGIYIKGPVGLLVPAFAGFTYIVLKAAAKMPNARRWVVGLIVCAFAGTMVPGVGPLICVAPGAVILYRTRGLAPLAMRWFGIGLALCVLLIVPWLAPMLVHAESEVKGSANEIMVRQNIGRFIKFFSREETGEAQSEMEKKISRDMPHQAPFYYYYYAFPMLCVPWVILLPWACAPLLRRRALREEEWRKRLFLFSIVAGVVLFFSMSASKREIYTIPAIPAMAMLVARYFENLFDRAGGLVSAKASRMIILAFAGLIGLLAAAFLVVIIAPPVLFSVVGIFSDKGGEIGAYVESALKHAGPMGILCGALMACAGIALVAAGRVRWKIAFGAVAALCLVLTGTVEYLVYPRIANEYKSARAFSEDAFARIGDSEFAWYGEAHEGVLFYSHRRIPEIVDLNGKDESCDELAQYLTSEAGKRKFVLTTRRRWKGFLLANRKKQYVDMPLYERHVRDVGSKELILISTEP